MRVTTLVRCSTPGKASHNHHRNKPRTKEAIAQRKKNPKTKKTRISGDKEQKNADDKVQI